MVAGTAFGFAMAESERVRSPLLLKCLHLWVTTEQVSQRERQRTRDLAVSKPMIKKYGLEGEHFGDFVIHASNIALTTDVKNWYDRGWRGTAIASYVATPPST